MRETTTLVEVFATATGRRAPELVHLLRRLPGRALPEPFDELVEVVDGELTAQLDVILAHP